MLIPLQGSNGRILVDQETLDYIDSSAPNPTQSSLDTLLSQTRGVRVYSGGASRGEPLSDEPLWEITDEIALESLGIALRINDGPHGHCMCHGDAALEFLGASGDRLAVIGVHHGESIRWNAWCEDAELTRGSKILKWLNDRGVWDGLQHHRKAPEDTKLSPWTAVTCSD